jgi:hypothetical protein
MRALSIMQPWSWLIVNGHKAIENRDWSTSFRGPVLIHAGKKIDNDADDCLRVGSHPVTGRALQLALPTRWETGGIVGEAEIVGCVSQSNDPWFVGRHGFLIRNARPLPFQPCRGALGFFVPELSEAQHG